VKLINNIITKIDEFPTLPTIYTKIEEVTNDPRATASDVANIISQDQASATKVLKLVNSPIFGFKRNISTISQSVVMLGFDEIKKIVLTISIIDAFKDIGSSKYLKPIDLWKYSIAMGIISKIIAENLDNTKFKVESIEKVFLCGVLHGIGKLLFMKMLPELYDKVITYSYENKVSTRETEIKIIGMHNSTAGRLLSEKWNLPSEIKDVIKYYNVGDIEGEFDINVAIVHVASFVVDILEFGKSGEFKERFLNSKTFNKLDLPNDFFTKNLPRFVSEYKESINLLLSSNL
jgi:HD-like signal output (HDOD) protein